MQLHMLQCMKERHLQLPESPASVDVPSYLRLSPWSKVNSNCATLGTGACRLLQDGFETWGVTRAKENQPRDSVGCICMYISRCLPV